MFEYDSRIAVGVSGGKDSLALLHLLHHIEARQIEAELVAVCVDEGVSGYRDEALRIAENNCKLLDIEMHTVSFKELFNESMDEIAVKDRELGTCSYCGVLRRKALNDAARQVDADIIATGHNLDDMAQSILLNILRGDMKRVKTFNPGGQKIEGYLKRVKPLCMVPEKETTYYAYINNLEFQSVPCPYADEAMRNDARIFLNQMEYKRPGTLFTLLQTGLNLRQINPDAQVINKCNLCGAPTTGEICRVCQLTKL